MQVEGLSRRQFLTALGVGAVTAGLALDALPGDAADLPGGEDSWSFAVASDPHLREDRPGELSGVDKFRKVLARLPALEPRPDFLLLLGDIHPEKLEPIVSELPVPVHAIMGNHEHKTHRELLRKLFPQDFQGKDFYSFTHKDSLFIALCDAAAGDHVGHFESQDITPAVGQGEWLEQQLQAGQKLRRCIVYGHVPPEPHCRPNYTCLSQNDGRWLQEQIRRCHPTALFFGHLHERLLFEVDGVPVHGVRSCNWNFRDEPPGFLHVKVLADRLEVITLDTV